MITLMSVCTGNICRSPAGELLLREYLGDLVNVESSGTYGMVGHSIPREMRQALETHDIDGSSHRARQLTKRMIQESDLVIAMAESHRRWILQEDATALRKTVLLNELAMAAEKGFPLNGTDPAERLRSVPHAVTAARAAGLIRGAADVPDPYYGSQDDYDASFEMIDNGIRLFANWVRGV